MVLLDTDKQFMNFGYEAEDAYNEIVQDDSKNHAEYYYFRRFKMALHTQTVSLLVNIVLLSLIPSYVTALCFKVLHSYLGTHFKVLKII